MESKSRAELVRIGKLLLKMITIEKMWTRTLRSVFGNGKLKKALFQFEGYLPQIHTRQFIQLQLTFV